MQPGNSSEPRPKVSVVMITYNHERFIEQAVRSVLMQKAEFNYDIVIGEDCSTDRTRDILLQLQRQYPDRIKLLLQPQNIGMLPNFVATLNQAEGEYIALLEGDDYWIDPYKLMKQVEFLKNNPDYVLICNNAVLFHQAAGRVSGLVQNAVQPFDFDTRNLMLSNPCPTLTVMFKNGLVNQFPSIYFEGTGGDRRLYLLISQFGKCRFIPEITGVYRVHSSSVTNTRDSSYRGKKRRLKNSIECAERWNSYFSERYEDVVSLVRHKSARMIVLMALKHLDIRTALEYVEFVNQNELKKRSSTIVICCLKAIRRIAKLFKSRAQHRASPI